MCPQRGEQELLTYNGALLLSYHSVREAGATQMAFARMQHLKTGLCLLTVHLANWERASHR